MNEKSELLEILTQTKQYLQEQKLLGVDMYPSNKKNKVHQLNFLQNKVRHCKKCNLGKTRIKAVFGEGNHNTKVIFVGEGPGHEEDRQGKPFVGRSGQLLTKIIESIGLTRESVYIANVVKCHPMINPKKPELRMNDRPPTREEVDTCFWYLKEQIKIINPKIVCLLGNSAYQSFLDIKYPKGHRQNLSKVRGKIVDFIIDNKPVKILPTYHPAALLRNPNLKRDVWTDMKLLKKLIS